MANELVSTCLYCDAHTDDTTGLAHVLPESIQPGGPVLPRGAICDPCNHYFGQKLESMLIRHPFIALPLQFLGLPGKRGHVRKQVGLFETGVGLGLRFPVYPTGIRTEPDGSRVAKVVISPALDPHFDLSIFRRVLHLVAFNYFILHKGVELASAVIFDSIRRYARSPQPGERWPFIQDSVPPAPIEAEVGVRFITRGSTTIVGIRLFNTDYYVDLQNTGILRHPSLSWRGPRPLYLGPDVVAYRPPTGIEAGKFAVEVDWPNGA